MWNLTPHLTVYAETQGLFWGNCWHWHTWLHIIIHDMPGHGCAARKAFLSCLVERRKSRLPHTEIIKLTVRLCCISHCVTIEKSDSVLCFMSVCFLEPQNRSSVALQCLEMQESLAKRGCMRTNGMQSPGYGSCKTNDLTPDWSRYTRTSRGIGLWSWLCMHLNRLAFFMKEEIHFEVNSVTEESFIITILTLCLLCPIT